MRKTLLLITIAMTVLAMAPNGRAQNVKDPKGAEILSAGDRFDSCVAAGGDYKFCCEFHGGKYNSSKSGTVSSEGCMIAGRRFTNSASGR